VSEEEKKPDRYNTVFLVSQIQAEQSRNKKIGIAVAIVLVLVIIYLLFIKQPAPPEVPHSGEAPAAAPGTPPPAPGTPPPAPAH
jgi:hypothetical protein